MHLAFSLSSDFKTTAVAHATYINRCKSNKNKLTKTIDFSIKLFSSKVPAILVVLFSYTLDSIAQNLNCFCSDIHDSKKAFNSAWINTEYIFEINIENVKDGVDPNSKRKVKIYDATVITIFKGYRIPKTKKIIIKRELVRGDCYKDYTINNTYLFYGSAIRNHFIEKICSRTRLISDSSFDLDLINKKKE